MTRRHRVEEYSIIRKHHTIIPQISVRIFVFPSVRLSVCPSISTKTVRTVHFTLCQCIARNPTMCILYLSLYGCVQIIQLNDFV